MIYYNGWTAHKKKLAKALGLKYSKNRWVKDKP
jgi:hypothetical protein